MQKDEEITLAYLEVPGYTDRKGGLPSYEEFKKDDMYLVRKCMTTRDPHGFIKKGQVAGYQNYTEFFVPLDDPEVGALDELGKSYRGKQNTTMTGKPCRSWDSEIVRETGFRVEDYPSDGLVENYCRNPITSQGLQHIWCFINDKDDVLRPEQCQPIQQRLDSVKPCHQHVKNCALCDQIPDYECKICMIGYILNTFIKDNGEKETACVLNFC